MRTDHLPKMPKRFTDLRFRFAWLKAGIDSARTKKQVKETLDEGRRLLRDAEGSNKKVARAGLRALGRYARKRLSEISDSS